MQNIIKQHSQLTGLALGLFGALVLLALTAKPGAAEKADVNYCGNGYASLCKLVETCEPKGFEDNGKCKWIYTASRSYWR